MKNLFKRLMLSTLVLTAGTGHAGMWNSFSTFLSKNKQQTQVAAALAVGAVCAAAYLYLRGTDQSVRIYHLEKSQDFLSSSVDLYKKDINNLQDKLGRAQEENNNHLDREDRAWMEQRNLRIKNNVLTRDLQNNVKSHSEYEKRVLSEAGRLHEEQAALQTQLHTQRADFENQLYQARGDSATMEQCLAIAQTQWEQQRAQLQQELSKAQYQPEMVDMATQTSIDEYCDRATSPWDVAATATYVSVMDNALNFPDRYPGIATAAASDFNEPSVLEPVTATDLQDDLSDCIFVKLINTGNSDDRDINNILSKSDYYSPSDSTVCFDNSDKNSGQFYGSTDENPYSFDQKYRFSIVKKYVSGKRTTELFVDIA